MKLSKNNVWLFFYQVLYCNSNKYAKSICDLFWGGILGFLLFFTAPLFTLFIFVESLITKRKFLYVAEDYGNDYFIIWAKHLGCLIAWVVLTLMGIELLGYVENIKDMPTYIWLIAWLVPTVGAGIIGAIIIGVSKVIYVLINRKKEQKEPGIIISYIKAKKNKICPRIEWVDKNK